MEIQRYSLGVRTLRALDVEFMKDIPRVFRATVVDFLKDISRVSRATVGDL